MRFFEGSSIAANGPDPWDIRVRDEGFYARVLKDGSLVLEESYMEGWWDARHDSRFAPSKLLTRTLVSWRMS